MQNHHQQRLKQQQQQQALMLQQQQSLYHPALLAPPMIEPIPSGNLPPGFDPNTCRMTEPLLQEVFASTGPLEGCKLIRKDKSSYGFIHYFDRRSAALAIMSLNGRHLFGQPIKVNWAYASGQREDTTGHFNIFVGDLSPEVTDAMLYACFSVYASCSDARVMWDQKTGRSRGFGFVSFRNQQDAQIAINDLTGKWLGSRQIRCNWATKGAGVGDENQVSDSKSVVELTNGSSEDIKEPTNGDAPENNPQYTTVYVGNLAPEVTQLELHRHFHSLGAGGIGGSILLMLSHGLVSSALFLCVGVLYDRHKTRLVRYYRGLVSTIPNFSTIFFFFTLSNMSLPGTSSFIGEFIILVGAFQRSSLVATLAALGMILGAAYSLWLYNRVVSGNLKPDFLHKFSDLNGREVFIFIPFLVGVVWMGVYPKVFSDCMHTSPIYTLQLPPFELVKQALNMDGDSPTPSTAIPALDVGSPHSQMGISEKPLCRSSLLVAPPPVFFPDHLHLHALESSFLL
nr:oligouridylate-binding protein 1B-like [Tanacetum cinerariifolium]